MNKMRDFLQKKLEEEDVALFEKIKDQSNPDILDLWSLSEKRFINWRKIHDFPILLKHFDEKLLLFKEWKSDNRLNSELIIRSGFITPFLENKKGGKKNTLYLIDQLVDGEKKTIVSYVKLEGEKEYLGQKFHFTFLQTFVSYLDWLEERQKKQVILYINSRSGIRTDQERVFIHADVYAPKSDFELLKMGGVDLPVNGYNLLFRGKTLEFVNLSRIRMAGDVNFGEYGNLNCHYCACDNWLLTDFNMPMVKLNHCSVTDFNVINSTIQQWEFYDCLVDGDFLSVKLYMTTIIGGNFNPMMQDCTLNSAHIFKAKSLADANFNGYKAFKKIYQNQGDDDIAKNYFIQENEFIRKKLNGWPFITKTVSYLYWEYGRKPHRIIYFSLAIIIIFGGVFFWQRNLIAKPAALSAISIWDCFYFSTVTFTTVGYGDFSPTGWLKLFCALEAFTGVINMGFIIAGYSHNKY